MRVEILSQERIILEDFKKCKIPIIFKDDSISYQCDLMECYEELFTSSYALLSGRKIPKAEIFCVFDNEFILLLDNISKNYELEVFCDLSKKVISIMKKYSY